MFKNPTYETTCKTLQEGVYIGKEIAADSEDAKLPLHGPNQWPREVRWYHD